MTSRSDDEPAVEVTSPVCSMIEADDAYMGYAGKAELAAFLNKLLEAEHGGARVTLKTAGAAGTGPIAELMRTIQRDEARWCAMVLPHIKALGDAPSPKVGAFYDKAMAIADLADRIPFLNRGQGWVVRKLREMLPRVRDNQLHTDLTEMLRSHEANIALATDAVRRAVNDAGTRCAVWADRCRRSQPKWRRSAYRKAPRSITRSAGSINPQPC